MKSAKVRVLSGFLSVAAVVMLSSGCGKHSEPNFVYMPEMWYSPAYKAQEVGAVRYPVAGTVPRGHQPYRFMNSTADEAGKQMTNPLRRTEDVLKRGQAVYNVHCIVCHGPGGEGDGSIVPKFPRPPSLLSDKVRTWPDGSLFHVMTAGLNLMPSYRGQVDAADRWAVVHYVRALQKAKNPTDADLKAAGI